MAVTNLVSDFYATLNKAKSFNIGAISSENKSTSGQSPFGFNPGDDNISLWKNYSHPNKQQSRCGCGCFACRAAQGDKTIIGPLTPRDLEPWQYENKLNIESYFGSEISTTPANAGIYSKSSSEVANLTLDSLAALNSPYIAGTFVGAKWGSIDPDSGTTTELSYYITPPGVTLSDGSLSVALTAAEHNAIGIANAAFTDVANLSFTETSTGDTDANFRWSFSTSDTLAGRADFPGLYGNVTSDVIIYSNYYSGNSGAMNAGGFYYITLPHELGHALGLAHPHNGGGTWDYSPYNGNYGSELFPGLDEGDENVGGDNGLNSTPFSTMSYNDRTSILKSPNPSGGEDFVTPSRRVNYGFGEGLGAFDIATIQYLYGPNTSKGATTDDVYLLDSTTLNGYKTIWDNGGIDSISAVNAGSAAYIDLRNATLLNEAGGGGYISRVDNTYVGYTIAYNTTGTAIIENAIGSNSSDRIIGNSSANSIDGGTGNDVLNGRGGNDQLIGGAGVDTAVFSAANNRVNLNSTGWQNTGDGRDRLIQIERVNAGSGNDVVIGNRGANVIRGEFGNDVLHGRGGNDLLVGGPGVDTAVFSAANNRVNLNSTGWQNTGDGRDRLVQIERVNAGGGNDVVIGNRGANVIRGGFGNDVLHGRGGNDLLVAGSGNDLLVSGIGVDRVRGGLGRDTFRIERGAGHDIIKDFTNGQDRIHLGSGSAELQMTNRGDDVLIYQGTDLMARVVGAAAGDLKVSGSFLIGAHLSSPTLEPLFEDQWHLQSEANQGANVQQAWLQKTESGAPMYGTDVVIAIVDDGVEYTHEDLSRNYIPSASYDFVDDDNDPSPQGFHGTGVAGVAAGYGHNGIGISGAAPNASFSAIINDFSDSNDSLALKYALDTNDIYNNSWGPNDNGTIDPLGPLTAATLAEGVANGRNQKGVIYTWAGGNGRNRDDNSNYDGYANSRYVISVAAISSNGIHADFSEPGANLLISAPSDGGWHRPDIDLWDETPPGLSGITTTDIEGVIGYNSGGSTNTNGLPNLNDNNYTNDFGGTSSATPLASGIIALLLQANPELGWRDVQHILVDSASKVDRDSSEWFTNAAGKEFNHDYGFGRIDADAAVTLAKDWTNVSTETKFANSESPRVEIPDSGKGALTRTISIDQDIQIESIEIPFISNHSYAGNLGITLTSPGGTIATLAESRNDRTSGINFTFSAKAFWGESSKGNWTLTITDEAKRHKGILESWGINIYGTPGVNYDDQLGRGSSIQYDEVTGQSSNTYATAEALASVPSLASYLHYLETISKNVDIHESEKLIVATAENSLERLSHFNRINVTPRSKIHTNDNITYRIFEVENQPLNSTISSQGLSPIIESLGDDLVFAYPVYQRPMTSRASIQDSAEQFPIC